MMKDNLVLKMDFKYIGWDCVADGNLSLLGQCFEPRPGE